MFFCFGKAVDPLRALGSAASYISEIAMLAISLDRLLQNFHQLALGIKPRPISAGHKAASNQR